MARYRSSTDATARYAGVAFVATLWLGLLIGVSFLATPVKFQAPSLTLATALEVGQATFALFTRVEWGLVVLLALAVAWVGRTSAQLGLWIAWACWRLSLQRRLYGFCRYSTRGSPSSPPAKHRRPLSTTGSTWRWRQASF